MTLVRRIARPLLASMFVVGGLDSLRHPSAKVPSAKPLIDKLAGPLGLPDDPELLVRVNGAPMLGAGSLLALGKLPRLSAVALATTIVPTTFAGHRFWEIEDPDQRKQQRTHFLKNLGILGGVLLAAVDTEGKPGLGWRAQHAVGRGRRDAKRAARTARREAKLAASHAHDKLT